jgi:hypothetical protein
VGVDERLAGALDNDLSSAQAGFDMPFTDVGVSTQCWWAAAMGPPSAAATTESSWPDDAIH